MLPHRGSVLVLFYPSFRELWRILQQLTFRRYLILSNFVLPSLLHTRTHRPNCLSICLFWCHITQQLLSQLCTHFSLFLFLILLSYPHIFIFIFIDIFRVVKCLEDAFSLFYISTTSLNFFQFYFFFYPFLLHIFSLLLICLHLHFIYLLPYLFLFYLPDCCLCVT
jgi:hypothetical protein